MTRTPSRSNRTGAGSARRRRKAGDQGFEGLRAELSDRLGLEPSPMPDLPAPMLCTLVSQPFDSDDWTFETKYDGLRVLARFDGQDVSLMSRNNKEQRGPFPDVAEALRAGLGVPAVVDGEVVCFDDQGRSSFRALQQRFHLADAAEVQRRAQQYPASIYLFDILYLDGFDLTPLPLAERQALLKRAVRWSDRVRPTGSEPGRGIALLEQACREGGEGIIGKRLDSRYVPGRSDAWVKVKCLGRQEFVIAGFTDPQRSRVGLGALLVGYYADDGQTLLYAGKVGTGFTRQVLLDLREQLGAIEQPRSPFGQGDPPVGDHVHWVRPKLVAEIAFGEWTQNGLLRQPRFEGLRADKAPRDCRRERPRATGQARRRAGADKARATPKPKTQSRKASQAKAK